MGGCAWAIYFYTNLCFVTSVSVINMPPILASAEYAAKKIMMAHKLFNAPLSFMGFFSSDMYPKNKFNPLVFRNMGSYKYKVF